MARKIDLTKSPESHCPRWDSCSINDCPLSKKRFKNDSSDPSKIHKEKCTSKRIRVEIGTAFNLPMLGMTAREFNGARKWEKMTEKDREIKKANLLQNSPVARYNSKGYKLVRKRSVNPRLHKETPQECVIMHSREGFVGGVE